MNLTSGSWGGVGGLLFDHAGAGVDLGPAGAVQQQLHIHGALGSSGLVHILLRQDPQIGRGNQVTPGLPLQVQGLPGEDVHIPQADALEEGGLVDTDELGQGESSCWPKVLPPGVGHVDREMKFWVRFSFHLPSAEIKL